MTVNRYLLEDLSLVEIALAFLNAIDTTGPEAERSSENVAEIWEKYTIFARAIGFKPIVRLTSRRTAVVVTAEKITDDIWVTVPVLEPRELAIGPALHYSAVDGMKLVSEADYRVAKARAHEFEAANEYLWRARR